MLEPKTGLLVQLMAALGTSPCCPAAKEREAQRAGALVTQGQQPRPASRASF